MTCNLAVVNGGEKNRRKGTLGVTKSDSDIAASGTLCTIVYLLELMRQKKDPGLIKMEREQLNNLIRFIEENKERVKAHAKKKGYPHKAVDYLDEQLKDVYAIKTILAYIHAKIQSNLIGGDIAKDLEKECSTAVQRIFGDDNKKDAQNYIMEQIDEPYGSQGKNVLNTLINTVKTKNST